MATKEKRAFPIGKALAVIDQKPAASPWLS
jgi:hypothetical protein